MNYDIKRSGERIRQLRKEIGYTQERLAQTLNIDRSLLSHIEAGKRGCSIDLLIRLSDVFNVSLDLLVLGRDKTALDTSSRNLLRSDITELIDRLESFRKRL